MKDVTHHLKQLQKKVIQSSKKSEATKESKKSVSKVQTPAPEVAEESSALRQERNTSNPIRRPHAMMHTHY